MKAIQIAGVGQPLQRSEVPVPTMGPGDVLVKITAAGICHSDVHYADGVSALRHYPLTPGHEVAGRVIDAGSDDRNTTLSSGDRVCLHYLVTCGECERCRSGRHQWCKSAEMIGKDRDGGYAEYIVVPARNAIRIPDGVPDEHAAVIMCSSATSLHAMRKARYRDGETVAIYGCGGLGSSAIQIARILGAGLIIGVDRNPAKLALAEDLGANPVDASRTDPISAISNMTNGAGADVVLELVGLPETVRQATASAAIGGRVALVGITNGPVSVNPYRDLIGKEVELIGVSDHHPEEIVELLGWAASGAMDFSRLVTRAVGLDLSSIQAVFDELRRGEANPRTVIQP